MHDKIREYRARAAACKAAAQSEPGKASSWLEVGEEWSRMADDLERKLEENLEANEVC